VLGGGLKTTPLGFITKLVLCKCCQSHWDLLFWFRSLFLVVGQSGFCSQSKAVLFKVGCKIIFLSFQCLGGVLLVLCWSRVCKSGIVGSVKKGSWFQVMSIVVKVSLVLSV
jgi:hypothetical protein